VVVNGERLFKRDIHTFRRVFPKSCKLLYSYGATECGNISRHVIQEDTPVEDPIPVGRPPGDKELRFFRMKREAYVELSAGEAGEIAVIGSNLSSSYWSDPEMTGRKYRPLPGDDGKRMYMTGDFGRIGKDGLLYLYNRNDRQLKIHGYRVDLSEIEAVLNNDEHVTHAVVVTAEDNSREPRLIAYVALSGDSGEQEVLLGRVKKAATTRLPSYMLPHQYVAIDVMPTTHRGKVDQQALTAMPLASEREEEEIVSETEKIVIEAWGKIFERDHVSLDDDILELGVTSLLGMEMCLVLGRKFSIEVPYTQLASCPTPRQLSAFIDSKLA
jgi:acyl-coenzyme A synthetase/AMP-(fatty) acid ligase